MASATTPDKKSSSNIEIPHTTETTVPESKETSSASQDTETSPLPDNLSPGLNVLFKRITSSDLIIMSVQKDAPDPTEADQMKYLICLLQEKPTQFLHRYLSCIKPEDVALFKEHRSDPIVTHYLQQLTKEANEHKVIRNRRYKRMQELISEGVYFSDEEMKERDQKLHYQMIGQFETEEERDTKVRAKMLEEEAKFSSFLLHASDRQDYMNNNMVEEEEEDDDEDEEDMIQCGSKEELAEQFRNIMIQRFLGGEDTDHISYMEIDYNEKYDDLVMRSRDAEDAYFDCESEEECEATEQMEDDREFNPPPLRPRKTSSSEDKS